MGYTPVDTLSLKPGKTSQKILGRLRRTSQLKILCLCNISNTRCVSSDIQTLRSRLKKRGAAEFFKRLRGVCISGETHCRVFDMASQMINNSWRN